MSKLQRVKTGSGSYTFIVNVPVQLVRAKGWLPGQILNWTIDTKGKIIITEGQAGLTLMEAKR